MAVLAAWLAGGKWQDSLRMGAYFAGGLAGSLLVLSAVAWALLRGLRQMLRVWPDGWPAAWRHGLANLYRPGNQAGAVLVAFGLGVMFTSTIYLVQRSMLREIAASAPPGLPNVYLIDVQSTQRDAVIDALRDQPDIENAVELIPSVAARIVRFNGTEMAGLEQKNPARRFRATQSVTWADAKPGYLSVVSGQWWTPEAESAVSVREDLAKALALGIGSALELTSTSRELNVRVAAIHKVDEVRPGNMTPLIFSRKTLDGLPAIYFGGLRVRPPAVPRLQKQLFEKFPTVSVINVADVIQTVQEVVDQIALIVRFISAFAILAGVVILASSVAGTRFRRIREVVILKTLGGTRRRIGRIFSAEFTLLGVVAGLLGGLLASLFANVLLVRFFSGTWQFDWAAALVAMAGSALIANVAGWAASARILGQKPLEVLRNE
jgi:putative ABC transport system permease protein